MYPIPTLDPQIWPPWWPSFLAASGGTYANADIGPHSRLKTSESLKEGT